MESNEKFDELEEDIPYPEVPYADLCKIFERKNVQLILVWGENLNKNRQVIILKKLYPKLNELTATELYEIIRKNKVQWKFAEMRLGCALDLVEEAKKLGLNIVLKEIKTVL